MTTMGSEERFTEFMEMMRRGIDRNKLVSGGYEKPKDIIDRIMFPDFSLALIKEIIWKLEPETLYPMVFCLVEMGMVFGQVFPIRKYLSEELIQWINERKEKIDE